jgi:hypothetical protein
MSLEHHMHHAAHADGHGEHGEEAHGHESGEHGSESGEHGHGHGHGGNLGRDAGILMAALGIVLAFGTALVGSERTEFIASLVEQTKTAGQSYAIAAKHRVIQAQLQQLHARLPDADVFGPAEKDLTKLVAEVDGTPRAVPVHCVRLEARNILETVTPAQADMDRFAWLVMRYSDQKEAAKEWAESFEGAIDAHRRGNERYEIGQLCAEFGIVVVSIGMLLKSRKIWWVALLLALAGAAIVVVTWLGVAAQLKGAEKRIVEAGRRYASLSSEAADEKADEELLDEIERMK